MANKTIRQIRIEGNVAYVPLTKGYEATIDAADAPLVEQFNWQAQERRRTVYAVRTDRSEGKSRSIYMHRAITGNLDSPDIDHIDGEGLNNRRENLRPATVAQNQHNRRLNADNTSGFKGVSWSRGSKKWQAQIKLHLKVRHLGYYDTPENAHAAYVKASAELHGSFGRTA